MIIVIRSTKSDEVIDGVVQNYRACYPVTNEHEMVVGSAWLAADPGHHLVLVVLDTVEIGAMDKWLAYGKHVLTSDMIPGNYSDWPEEILIVHDRKRTEWAVSSLYGETVDDMVAICEEAFFG